MIDCTEKARSLSDFKLAGVSVMPPPRRSRLSRAAAATPPAPGAGRPLQRLVVTVTY
jgi:hypothetical protein